MRAALLIAMFTIAVPDREAPKAKDKPTPQPLPQQLVGEWQLVNAVIGGQAAPKQVDGTVMVFTGKEIQIQENGNKRDQEEATYTLDVTKSPMTIDILPKRGGNMNVQGILKIEADQLTLCFAHGGNGARPTEFASPVNSRVALMHLKRIKK